MALFSTVGLTFSGAPTARQASLTCSTTGAHLAFGPAYPGTGFENPPPRPIVSGAFKFLKLVGLASVGLRVADVPFHGGWLLMEWRPSLSVAEWFEEEFDRLCEEIESEERTKGQIDLNLGLDFGLSDEEPPVEVPGVVPTVVVDGDSEEDGLEEEVSRKETVLEQAEGTGRAVPEEARKVILEEAVGTDEAVPVVEETGESPDPMVVDLAVRTGGRFVEGLEGVDPDLGSGEDDLWEEDFPEDIFEKVGDLSPEQSHGQLFKAKNRLPEHPWILFQGGRG